MTSSNATSLRRRSVLVRLGSLTLAALGVLRSPQTAFAQPADAPIREYATQIESAALDLAAGKIEDARRKLDATTKSQRGVEFDYLSAATSAKGGEAIQRIVLKGVESRYGILNQTTGQVAFICRDGALRIYDLKEPATEPKTDAYEGKNTTWSGAFSADGSTFVEGHENGDVVVWNAKEWKVRKVVPMGEKWPVRELAVGPRGEFFVAETKTELQLWSLEGDAPKKVAAVGPRYNFGEGLAVSPKGDLVATGGMFDVLLHDAKSGVKSSSFRHASYTMGLEFSPDGKRIASAPRGNVNRFLGVFDVASGSQKWNAGPFAGYVTGHAWSHDGRRIVATTAEMAVKIFDADTGVVVLTIRRPANGVKPALSADGRFLCWSESAGYCFVDLRKPAVAVK